MRSGAALASRMDVGSGSVSEGEMLRGDQDAGNHAVTRAIAALGPGPLTERGVAEAIRPLFSQTLASGRIYLANHTLGRPLDQMQADVREGTELWARSLRDAWSPWLAEERRYRETIAGLLGMTRPDLVVPKVSAGQALRTVLNALPEGATVLTTRDEFASVAFVLGQYAALGRIKLRFAIAEPGPSGRHGCWTARRIVDELSRGAERVSLTVISQVFYTDALLFEGIPEVAQACRAHGGELLVDCYHALGVVPFTMDGLGCDYLIGGCYKYLRGGPGAAFLALAPHQAEKARLDAGWFAQVPGTDAWQAGGPARNPGGDGWLDGTPPILTYYQARSGLAFTRAVGVERLRAYSLEQLGFLRTLLAQHGIESRGGGAEHGAFLTIASPRAPEVVRALGEQGIVVDERAGRVRLCPDVLTRRAELEQAVEALRLVLRRDGS